MTIHETINPLALDLRFMAMDNNPIDMHAQPKNPTNTLRHTIFDRNPDGKVPVLNPEHYIHPLTQKYSRGPLDFSR